MDDVINSLNKKLKGLEQRYGKSEVVLACECVFRRIEIQQKELAEQAKFLYSQYNIAGFNSYGEHIDGIHLNQTFAGVFIAENVTNEGNAHE